MAGWLPSPARDWPHPARCVTNPKENPMPDLDKNELPHWADPSDYDRPIEDERLPDAPGDGTHIHSLDRCEHYIAGSEVGWLCGRFPMFTNIATARAHDGMTRRADLVTVAPDAEGEYWVVSLRSREGGKLPVAHRRQLREAEAFRDSVAAFIASWFAEWIADGPTADDLADHDEQGAADDRAEAMDGNLQLLDPLPEESNR